MKSLKGPALFLGQFAGDAEPFNSWDAITKWAADCGYIGVQVPSWDARLFDLEKASSSKDYCDEFKGQAAANGIEVTDITGTSRCRTKFVCAFPQSGLFIHGGWERSLADRR